MTDDPEKKKTMSSASEHLPAKRTDFEELFQSHIVPHLYDSGSPSPEIERQVVRVASILLEKTIGPKTWTNMQAHHLFETEQDIKSTNRLAGEVFRKYDVANTTQNEQKELALLIAAKTAYLYKSQQSQTQGNADQQLYYADVIGENSRDLSVFMLRSAASTLGLITLDPTSWLSIGLKHDNYCATTVGATDSKPYGRHCDKTTPFIPSEDLSQITLDGVDERDDVSDKNEAYLCGLRDLCAAKQFEEGLIEVESRKEYRISGKLLKQRIFFSQLNSACYKYEKILHEKHEKILNSRSKP